MTTFANPAHQAAINAATTRYDRLMLAIGYVGGDATLKYYEADGTTLLRTVTHGPYTAVSPYNGLTIGAKLAESPGINSAATVDPDTGKFHYVVAVCAGAAEIWRGPAELKRKIVVGDPINDSVNPLWTVNASLPIGGPSSGGGGGFDGSGRRIFDLGLDVNGNRNEWGWPTSLGNAPSTVVQSTEIVLTNLQAVGAWPAIETLTVQGSGQIRKNGGSYGSSVSVTNGDYIQYQITSGATGNDLLQRVLVASCAADSLTTMLAYDPTAIQGTRYRGPTTTQTFTGATTAGAAVVFSIATAFYASPSGGTITITGHGSPGITASVTVYLGATYTGVADGAGIWSISFAAAGTTYVSATTSYTATANGSGAWSVSASQLLGGDHTTTISINGGTATAGTPFKTSTGVRQVGGWNIETANNDRAPQTMLVGPLRTYTTIQAALDVARAGDTIEVDSGTYGPVRVQRSGTASLPITVTKAPGAATRPIIDGSSATYFAIWNQGHFVKFKGFDAFTHPSYNPASPPSGGPLAIVRVEGHGQVYEDCEFHHGYTGVLSHDDYAGETLIDRCWVRMCGGLPSGADYAHGLYVTTNQIKFPLSKVRILQPQIKEVAGNGIKIRAAYHSVVAGRIEMGNYAEAYYAIQSCGPNGPYAPTNHSSDLLGNIITVQRATGLAAVIQIGGDGNPLESKMAARVAKNTVILPSGSDAGLVYARGGLVSVIDIDNAVMRVGGGAAVVPAVTEYNTAWSTGRKVTAIKNALPSIPAKNYTEGGGVIDLTGGNFVVAPAAITSAATVGADVTRSGGSVLTGAGTDLSTYTMPTGYELAASLEPYTLRASPTAPAWGSVLTALSGSAADTNVGAA